MKIVILGSGNVATVLAALIKAAGHELIQVVSRNANHARSLASLYKAAAGSLTDEYFSEADIYIIALNDSVLDSIEKITALKGKFVVHTAGAISIDALKECSNQYGVLYPLQTLSKMSEEIPDIPFLVDGNTRENRHFLLELAKSLSGKAIEANDQERMAYHVAAVFVSNFANHMLALGELFCREKNLNFPNLFPLMNEVNARANKYSPFLTQTGPAMRDDVYTLNRHLQTLVSSPDLRYIYLKMTESIIKMHKKK